MDHPIHKVTGFKLTGTFELKVDFADNTSQTIDFEPVLKGELFGPLSDPHVFQAVRLDDEVHTLVWPNGADFDPTTLHDWPDHEKYFGEMASRWKSTMVENG